MATSSMDIVVKAIDNASGVLKQISSNGASSAKTLASHWKGIGVALAGVAAGLSAMAQQEAPLTTATLNLADATGLNESAVRKLVLSTADSKTGIEDTITTMQHGREQGLSSAAALKTYAKYWDDVAKATNGSAPELAQAAVSLKAIGISAGDSASANKALGFIIRNTSIGVAPFLAMVGRLGPTLRGAKFDINSTAAILGLLRNELGYGPRAMLVFNKAVKDSGLAQLKASDSDEKKLAAHKKLLQLLGISPAMYDKETAKVQASGDVISQQAANYNKTITVMTKLTTAIKKLEYQYANTLTVVATYANIVAGVIPAIAIIGKLGKGFGLVAKAAWEFGGRMKIVTGLIKEQGIQNTISASIQNSKVVGAFKNVTSSVGKLSKSLGSKAISGCKSVIEGIGTSAVATGLQVAGVTLAFAALALAIYGVVKAHEAFQKACVQEAGALDNEKAALQNLYNVKGEKAAKDYLKSTEKTITPGSYNALNKFLNDYIVSVGGVPDKSRVGKFAGGGIFNTPTLGIIGEAGPEAVVPLTGGGGTVNHTMNHTGTMTVKVVNGEGQLQAVIPVVINQLRKEIRGGVG